MIKAELFKKRVLSVNDMDFVGICKSEALENEPKNHKPSELLKNCKSIVVFGRRMIDGAVQTNFRVCEENHFASQTSYADHAHYLAVNMLLMSQSYNIAQHLEKTYNAVAVPMPNNVIQDIEPEGLRAPYFAAPYQSGMPIDLAKAAVAAGLGEIGWNHRFLTAEDGPRVNLCAILTDAEFDEYDTPYAGPKLCDPEKCGICRECCPSEAIPAYAAENAESVEVAGKKMEQCKLDVNACTVMCMGMLKKVNPRGRDVVTTLHPSDEELGEAIKKLQKSPGMQMLDHLPSFYCDRCLSYCPVGNWEDKFRKKGLTKK